MKPQQPEDEDDFDIDIEDGGSKFSISPLDEEMEQESDSRGPPSTLNPQPRQKPLPKTSKGKASKKARRAVISDDDDDDGDDDSMPWRSDTAEDDPPSSPPQTRVIASSDSRTRKGKLRADLEDMDSLREDRPPVIGTKRPRPLDSEPAVDSKPPSPPTGPFLTAPERAKSLRQRRNYLQLRRSSYPIPQRRLPYPTSKATPSPSKDRKVEVHHRQHRASSASL
jgi:hypothetical protein